MTSPGGGRSLADVFVAMHVDTSRVPQEVRNGTEKQIGDAGEKAGSHFGKRMAAAIGAAALAGSVFVGAKLVQGFLGATQSASDLNETMSKTDVIFGKSAKSVKQWAANMASDFGQSQKTALDAAATFALYGKTAKLTGKDLFNFSTDLTGLASDMASFSNTSPEEAIDAIGAAMRGESDPIEKYGILMNEATLKSIALKKGIIDTTKGALTPQQRVLAVQALLFEQLGKKGSKTLGDFERTQASLANQQRIASAETENLKAKIGQALLPVMVTWYKQVNTKILPALNDLWAKHGPAVTAWLQKAAVKFGDLITVLASADWEGIIGKASGWFNNLKKEAGPALDKIKASAGPMAETLKSDLLPALKDLKEQGGTGLSDTIKVTGVAMQFAADHADLLAKALPYLVGAVIAFKVAQLASNVALAVSPVLRLLEIQATKKQTAAILANTASRAAETVATGAGTAATAGATAAENTGLLTKLRNTAATIASTVATKTVQAATIAWTGVQWLLNAALTANPIGLVVAAIVALIAIVVIAYQKNETFRKIVQAVWAAIKTAIKAVGDWFVNTLWPSLKKAYDQLMAVSKAWFNICMSVWKGIWELLSKYFGFMRDKVFTPLKNIITKTIPDAFKAGVEGIKTWWNKLQEYASKPVKFVIETVINKGLIGTFNKVSGFFGGPSLPQVNMPSGIGDGPGMGASAGKRRDGTGDGFGDVLSFIKGPASWIKGRMTSKIDNISGKFGNNPLTKVLTGAGKKLLGSLISKAKSLIEVGGDTGGAGTGGLRPGIRAVLAGLRGTFGNVPIISGYRPGATTLTGNASYHGSGRAVDIRPYLPWAQYLNAVYGGRLRELITPWQGLNILNGRPHTYTGAVWNQHNFAGGNAHIHAAMDDGGRRFLMPGLNVIPNGTGAREPIYGPAEISEVIEVLLKILDALAHLAPDLGREINGMGSTLRTRGRTGAWPRSA